MKRKNLTRNALFTSIVSLLLCVTMLVGTTFAWFTDSVESGINTIAAGNLDVELYYGKTTDPANKVTTESELFTDFFDKKIELWEPGVVAFTNLKVANVGTLALQYQLSINIGNLNYVDYEGTQYSLADALKVAVVEGGFNGTREDVKTLSYDYSLATFDFADILLAGDASDVYGIVIYWEPGNDAHDNLFNMNNGKTTSDGQPLHVDLGVKLFATQQTHEEDSFGPDYDDNTLDVDSMIYVTNIAELQAAVNAAENGAVITLSNDITGNLTVPQKPDVKFTIYGNDKNYTGTITVDGKSERYDTAGLTILGVNFVGGTDGDAYVALGGKSNMRYTNNVTVKDCTFSGANEEDVAIKSYEGGDWNLTVDGCVVNAGMHSLLQVANVEKGLKVTNCQVNSKNGINLNNTPSLEMNNCTFNVTGYAVRVGVNGSVNTDVKNFNIANSTLASACAESDDAVIVFRDNATLAVLNLKNTTLNGTPKFSGNNEHTTIVINGTVEVKDDDELVSALEKGEDVVLTDDVKIDPPTMSNAYGTTGLNVKNGQTIDGNGNILDIKGANGTWDSGINTTGGLIKNITVTGSFRGIFINHNSTHCERVVLENVIIDGTTYTISCDEGSNQGLTATNCTFNGWTSYAGTLGEAKFVNCNFGEGNGYAFCRPYAPTEFVGCDFEAGFTMEPRAAVTFENCTIGGVALTAENLATLVIANIANATVK